MSLNVLKIILCINICDDFLAILIDLMIIFTFYNNWLVFSINKLTENMLRLLIYLFRYLIALTLRYLNLFNSEIFRLFCIFLSLLLLSPIAQVFLWAYYVWLSWSVWLLIIWLSIYSLIYNAYDPRLLILASKCNGTHFLVVNHLDLAPQLTNHKLHHLQLSIIDGTI